MSTPTFGLVPQFLPVEELPSQDDMSHEELVAHISGHVSELISLLPRDELVGLYSFVLELMRRAA